ncbi:MAG: response regulator [Bacteriovoracaceae bacterium]
MILVVDDEPYISDSILEMLRHENIAAIQTNRPAEAIELMRKQKFVCVLTDIAMPSINGIELAQELRFIRPNIKMICVSGFSEIFEQDLLNAGFDHILPKPFTYREIVGTVKQYL